MPENACRADVRGHSLCKQTTRTVISDWQSQIGFALGDVLLPPLWAKTRTTYFLTFCTKAQAADLKTRVFVDDVIAVPTGAMTTRQLLRAEPSSPSYTALKVSPSLQLKLNSIAPTDTMNINIELSPNSMASDGDARALAQAWQSAMDSNSVNATLEAASMSTVVMRNVVGAHAASGTSIVTSQPESAFMEPEPDYNATNYNAACVRSAGPAVSGPR